MRMRLWRTLKSTGCGVLRDGVYILPAGVSQAATLAAVESEVKAAGGFAMTADLNIDAPGHLVHIEKLFERNNDYGALVQQFIRAKGSLRRLGKRKGETAVRRLRRSFEELAAIDFYPGHANRQAQEALTALEEEARELFAGGEPRRSRARVRRLDPTKYRDRTWATREDPWVDRLASAWLIKRFIDRNARFVWLRHPRDCPTRAIGFDFDGAEFTHAGNRVTYEVLLASFGLADDPALASIGAAVRMLDIGGIPVPDAKGLETVLRGVKQRTRSDDGAIREAAKIFELFYGAYAQSESSRTSE